MREPQDHLRAHEPATVDIDGPDGTERHRLGKVTPLVASRYMRLFGKFQSGEAWTEEEEGLYLKTVHTLLPDASDELAESLDIEEVSRIFELAGAEAKRRVAERTNTAPNVGAGANVGEAGAAVPTT